MALTSEQAFKTGFLQRCAEEGLTLYETKQRIKLAITVRRAAREKAALWPALGTGAAWLGNKTVNLGTAALSQLPGLASTLGTVGILAPIGLGAAGGYTAGKLTSGDTGLVEDAKNEEIAGEYQRLAEEAKRRARLKRLQSLTGKKVVALTPGD